MKVLEGPLPTSRQYKEWNTFFKVPKACGTKARAIFNCKAINEACERPPPFELAKVSAILELIGESTYFASLDFRHYFYQLGIPSEVKEMFRVGTPSDRFRLAVLPMGFSWSPFIAQGVTMALLAEAATRANASPTNQRRVRFLASFESVRPPTESASRECWLGTTTS